MTDKATHNVLVQAEPAVAWVGPLSFYILASDYFRGGNAALGTRFSSGDRIGG